MKYIILSGLLILAILEGEETKIGDSLSVDEETKVQEDQDIGDEEYLVYSATLFHMHNPNIKTCAMKEQTRVCQDSWMDTAVAMLYEEAKLNVDTTLIQDFVVKNQTRYTIKNNFFSPDSVILISDREIPELIGFTRPSTEFQRGWVTKFGERYPNTSGLFTFSRVGFNTESTTAMVYFSINEGIQLRGRGYLVLLVKQNYKWTVKGYKTLWIVLD